MSHETVYQSLFVQGRGALRHELHVCLRSGRAMRRNKKWTRGCPWPVSSPQFWPPDVRTPRGDVRL